MSLVTIRTPATLDLPPAFSLVALRESGDAFAHACRIADEAGAGTFVWVRRFDVAEFAVVLEPEEPLAEARKAFFLGMNAIGDAIASLCPPERGVTFGWPDSIFFDGGLVGGGRLGCPKRAEDDATPDWLVFSAIVRVAFAGALEPGQTPTATALEEEGFDGASPAVLVEAAARYFMKGVDLWKHQGFAPIGRDYAGRLAKARVADRQRLLDTGDLRVEGVNTEPVTKSLREGLKAVAWLDRDTGLPRLGRVRAS